MYSGGNGLGPTAGGLGVSALAYTGTGSLLLPLVITGLALALGVALLVRKRWLTQDAPA